MLKSGLTTHKSLMRFTPQFLEELRARLPSRKWWAGALIEEGMSPFQQEKSPSFTVNDPEGFLSRLLLRQARVVSFLMETEGVGFTEAVERLASMAAWRVSAA